MKRYFEKEMSVLRGHLSEMGHKSIEQVRQAHRALVEGNSELAAWIRAQDDEIDRLEMAVDAEAIRYLSLRAPVARELRVVLMGMNASHEFERVGDEASNIAKRVQKLARQEAMPPLLDELRQMGERVEKMLEMVLEDFMLIMY